MAEVSRGTQIPESRLFVFNPFPGFNCIVTALKSRTLALKTRTKFLLKSIRDISTKMTLILFPCIGFGPGFEYKQLGESRGTVPEGRWERSRYAS